MQCRIQALQDHMQMPTTQHTRGLISFYISILVISSLTEVTQRAAWSLSFGLAGITLTGTDLIITVAEFNISNRYRDTIYDRA